MAARLKVIDGESTGEKWRKVEASITNAEKIANVAVKAGNAPLELLERARAVLRELHAMKRSEARAKAAKLLKRASGDAVVILRGETRDLERLTRKKKVQGDDEKREPTFAEQISSWVKLGSAASAIFASVGTFFLLWIAYKVFFERR